MGLVLKCFGIEVVDGVVLIVLCEVEIGVEWFYLWEIGVKLYLVEIEIVD